MHVLIRSSGAFAIAAGILNVLSALPRQIPETAVPVVRRSGDVAALGALIGIYLFAHEDMGILGLVSFLIAIVGVLMLIASFRYQMAVSIYALGVLLLAIALIQTGLLPRWIPVLWIVAPVIALPGIVMSDLGDLFSVLAAIAYGAGFVGVGYLLITDG